MEGNVVGRIVNHAVSPLDCAFRWGDCLVGVWLLVGGRRAKKGE